MKLMKTAGFLCVLIGSVWGITATGTSMGLRNAIVSRMRYKSGRRRFRQTGKIHLSTVLEKIDQYAKQIAKLRAMTKITDGYKH